MHIHIFNRNSKYMRYVDGVLMPIKSDVFLGPDEKNTPKTIRGPLFSENCFVPTIKMQSTKFA